jgi:hypothetical protein
MKKARVSSCRLLQQAQLHLLALLGSGPRSWGSGKTLAHAFFQVLCITRLRDEMMQRKRSKSQQYRGSAHLETRKTCRSTDTFILEATVLDSFAVSDILRRLQNRELKLLSFLSLVRHSYSLGGEADESAYGHGPFSGCVCNFLF